MTKVLVIHDTDLSGAPVAKSILDSVVTGCGATPVHMSVFPAMDEKLLAKVKPEEWKEFEFPLDGYDKILCSGGLAASALFQAPRGLKVGKIRAKMVLSPEGTPTVVTWSPKTVLKDKEFFRDVEFDIRKLITQDAPTPLPDVEVEVVESVRELKTQLKYLHGASFLACDIETTGFNPVTADLLSLGFGGIQGNGKGYVLVVPQKYCTHSSVGEFLQRYSGTMIFHNLKFDTKHLWRAFGRFNYKVLADTMLTAYCIDERPFNRYRHLGLKLLSRMYFDAPDYEISMKEWLAQWAEAGLAERNLLYENLLEYMAYDCYYTAALYPILREEAGEESEHLLTYHDQHLVPASLMMAQMELTGCAVNIPYLKKMKKTIEAQLEEDMGAIRELVAEHTGREEFNPNSPKQVAALLYNAGDEQGLGLAQPKDAGRYAYKRAEGTVTTNADTLKVLARQCAKEMPAASRLINLILDYRVKSKILGTYVDGLLERVDDDGRIRGDFNLHGTATGRLSCSNPNLQNIPDASHVGFDIRRAYVPTKDWVMLEADYSQLELRVAALFSQDPVLLEAYRNGADIHQEVALLLWNKPKDEVTKYERYLAKCMNFGVIYGRGARSIATGPEMDNLTEMSGRSWSEKEIDAYFAKFKVGYKVLFDWMEIMKSAGIEEQYVEAPLGSRRRFPIILSNGDRAGVGRQIVNSPIQGFAAQLTVGAMIEMDKQFDPEKQRLLFNVHDAINAECRKDKKLIKETGELMKEIMESSLPPALCTFPTLPHAPFNHGQPLVYNLPFVADVTYGKSWGECKKSPLKIRIREDRTYITKRPGNVEGGAGRFLPYRK